MRTDRSAPYSSSATSRMATPNDSPRPWLTVANCSSLSGTSPVSLTVMPLAGVNPISAAALRIRSVASLPGVSDVKSSTGLTWMKR